MIIILLINFNYAVYDKTNQFWNNIKKKINLLSEKKEPNNKSLWDNGKNDKIKNSPKRNEVNWYF